MSSRIGDVLLTLHEEMRYLRMAIHTLEQLEQDRKNREFESVGPDGALRRRRGRKSMGPEERKVVSDRMRNYWASRKGSGS